MLQNPSFERSHPGRNAGNNDPWIPLKFEHCPNLKDSLVSQQDKKDMPFKFIGLFSLSFMAVLVYSTAYLSILFVIAESNLVMML